MLQVVVVVVVVVLLLLLLLQRCAAATSAVTATTSQQSGVDLFCRVFSGIGAQGHPWFTLEAEQASFLPLCKGQVHRGA
jgi:hypothetical protein